MRCLMLLWSVCLLALMVAVPGAQAAGPKIDTTLALGVAEPSPFLSHDQTTGAMAELMIKVTGRDLCGFFEVRNAFHDRDYLFRKSRIKAGLDLPIARDTALFVEYERAYRTGDEWGWAGVRFNLNRLFR